MSTFPYVDLCTNKTADYSSFFLRQRRRSPDGPPDRKRKQRTSKTPSDRRAGHREAQRKKGGAARPLIKRSRPPLQGGGRGGRQAQLRAAQRYSGAHNPALLHISGVSWPYPNVRDADVALLLGFGSFSAGSMQDADLAHKTGLRGGGEGRESNGLACNLDDRTGGPA
jgi:hypothetical protein